MASATETENPFPLASEKPYGTDAPTLDGTEAGASGDSSGNSISISTGGMIAIIVVVVVVILLGGMIDRPHLSFEILTVQSQPLFYSTLPRSVSGRSRRRSGDPPERSPMSSPHADQSSHLPSSIRLERGPG